MTKVILIKCLNAWFINIDVRSSKSSHNECYGCPVDNLSEKSLQGAFNSLIPQTVDWQTQQKH